jgi:ankyrin repeat protein
LQNIFVAQISPRFWVKLGDFGIAKRVTNQSTALRTEIGTPYFSAPETEPDDYQENFEYTNAVDLWSLGCVVYNCLAQRPPFQSRRAKALPFPMQPLKGRVHVDSVAFLECLLKVDPMTRCTAQEALDHPWLQNVSDSSIAADKGSGASTNDSSYSIPTLNGYDSINSQAALLDIQCSTSSRALKPLETPHVVTVSDLTAAATTNASESKGRTAIHAPRSVGLTATECELLGVGSALTTPVWTVPKDSGERTVLSKDSPVKDQLSKLATNEMNGQQSEVSEDMELINCFRVPYQISSGHMNTARRLIRRGTNLKIKDADGRTALHWAVMKCVRAGDGSGDVVRLIRELLERGAEIDARDNFHNTPLLSMPLYDLALEGTRLAVICLLLEYNADVNAKSTLGVTCLHQAVDGSRTRAYEVCRVIDVLLKHGADVNAKDDRGATALHYVQHSEVAERLLLAGIDVDAVDWFGETALQLAIRFDRKGVANAILSFRERPRKAQR